MEDAFQNHPLYKGDPELQGKPVAFMIAETNTVCHLAPYKKETVVKQDLGIGEHFDPSKYGAAFLNGLSRSPARSQ